MSGAEEFAAALKRAVTRQMSSLREGVGTVKLVPAVSGLAPAQAVVSGIADSAVTVTEESWCRAFRLAVDAGEADGRRVLVIFNDGQPVIVDVVMG